MCESQMLACAFLDVGLGDRVRAVSYLKNRGLSCGLAGMSHFLMVVTCPFRGTVTADLDTEHCVNRPALQSGFWTDCVYAGCPPNACCEVAR